MGARLPNIFIFPEFIQPVKDSEDGSIAGIAICKSSATKLLASQLSEYSLYRIAYSDILPVQLITIVAIVERKQVSNVLSHTGNYARMPIVPTLLPKQE